MPADPALVAHLVATTGLGPSEVARIVDDVVAFHAEATEAYVRRRHRELHAVGKKNAEIFEQVAIELRDRVVAPPVLSERQLRRVVYG